MLVMGVFYAQVGPDSSNMKGVVGKYSIGNRTENDELFADLYARNNLVIGG